MITHLFGGTSAVVLMFRMPNSSTAGVSCEGKALEKRCDGVSFRYGADVLKECNSSFLDGSLGVLVVST